jgi:hypothetical protein
MQQFNATFACTAIQLLIDKGQKAADVFRHNTNMNLNVSSG